MNRDDDDSKDVKETEHDTPREEETSPSKDNKAER